MLGRCETLNDIFIAGKFFKTGVRCNSHAKVTMENIEKTFDEKLKHEQEVFEATTTVAYVNVRSIKSLTKHIVDVTKEPYLMNSSVFCLSETWLSEGEVRAINGFFDLYESNGRGKGLAVYSRESLEPLKFTSSDGSAYAILIKRKDVNIMFLYLSQNFDWKELKMTLTFWISSAKPSVIMGDVNWHFDDNHPMKSYLENRGFEQCITRATHEGGHKLDHLYVSSSMREKFNFNILHQSIHFSDHDVIAIQYWNKDD